MDGFGLKMLMAIYIAAGPMVAARFEGSRAGRGWSEVGGQHYHALVACNSAPLYCITKSIS